MSSTVGFVQATILTVYLWNAFVVASSDVNQTTDQEVSSLLSVTSADETRRVRRVEAEMETAADGDGAESCWTLYSTAKLVHYVHSSVEADALSVAQEVRGLRHHVQALRMHSELSAIRSELQSLRSRVPNDVTEVFKPPVSAPVLDKRPESSSGQSTLPGSVYTRWGSGQCPPEAELVYSGVIGGSFYEHEGAASNALCLPLNPVFENYVLPAYYTLIYGAEYQVSNHLSNDLEAKCRVSRAACCDPHDACFQFLPHGVDSGVLGCSYGRTFQSQGSDRVCLYGRCLGGNDRNKGR